MTGSDSPTVRVITAYEAWSHAHLPRLVEEALEASVAAQTQPVEENLRRELAGMMRDCHTRLAQTFLQHRSPDTEFSSDQIEALRNHYIEDPNLPDENSFPAQDYSINHQHGAQVAPQTDSGYGSLPRGFERDSRELAPGAWGVPEGNFIFLDHTGRGDAIDESHHEYHNSLPDEFDWSALQDNDDRGT